MRFKLNGAALAVAVLSACLIAGQPARADNYQVRDGAGVAQSFCSRTWGALHYPCHLMFGLFGSTPTPVAVDADGNFKVSIQNATLPSNASTASAQAAGNASLSAIDAKLADQATAAKQDLANASAASIVTNTTSILTQATAAATGLGTPAQAAWSGSGAGSLIEVEKYSAAKIEAARALMQAGNVNLANIDADLGLASESACATDTGACSLTALLKRANERLGSIATGPLPVTCISGCSGSGGGGTGDLDAVTETLGSTTVLRNAIYDAAGNPVDWNAPVSTNLAAATTGGSTKYGYQSAASTNSTLVSAGAHTLHQLTLINTTATIYYLRLYDAALAPTCSSGTNFAYTIPIPASTSGAGVSVPLGPFGQAFTNGLAFCLTGGPTGTDNTAAATGVFLIASYK